MSHLFNDSVTYFRNSKPIPEIVLNYQIGPTGEELLTLLYAQPDMGPVLLAQGTTRGIAQVQQGVQPMIPGRVFGWQDNAVQIPAVAPASEPQAPTANSLQPELDAANQANATLKDELAKEQEHTAALSAEIAQLTAILNQKPEAPPAQPPSA